MKKINYICLDDESSTAAKILSRIPIDKFGLDIEVWPPQAFEGQTCQILAKYHEGRLDGLILDLRLDTRIPEGGKKTVSYTAPGLAAQLRNWQSMNPAEVGFPIILWSVEERLKKGFYPDITNQDLFDEIFTKGNVGSDGNKFSSHLVALVDGYRKIHKKIG